LAPRCSVADKDVSRARLVPAGVTLVAVDPRSATGFSDCAYYHGVARNRHRIAEIGAGLCIGGFHISLLAPGYAVADENVSRPRTFGAVVGLVAVNPGRAAGLRGCAYYYRV